MANPKWDKASVEQKLEMLREDIQVISDAHNRLGRDFRALLAVVEELRRSQKKN